MICWQKKKMHFKGKNKLQRMQAFVVEETVSIQGD